MELIKLNVEIESLKREQKEARIRNYFKAFGDKAPNFINFSFTSPSSIADYDLKYIGAISLLTEFKSDKAKSGKNKKDRSFFFVFLKGNSQRFNHEVFTTELFEVCGFFARTSMITIVFLFENDSIQYKYGSDLGKFSRVYKNEEGIVLPSLNFVKSPDEYIAKLIDRRKYLIDCYQAFSNKEKNSLPFIENDYLNTRETYLSIIDALTKGKKIVFVEGPAGSGKTILALRLLGFYKNSNLLIINEYFDQELKSIFTEMNDTDIRFSNHRGIDSTEYVKLLVQCNSFQIPVRDYFDFYKKFIFKKYWRDKGQTGIPDKNFWLEYMDTSRPNYIDDLKEFKTSYLNINSSSQPTGEPLAILDEGQRIFDETIIACKEINLTTIVFGDLQQKINPETDNLRDLIEGLKTDPLFELISMRYPIRISEPALEKIKYTLALTNEKKQYYDKDVYPIKIFDTCESFVMGFKSDKTSQKFYCSYQDIWRHEKDPSEKTQSMQKKVLKVSNLSYCVGFEFEDGYHAYPTKSIADKISSYYSKKLNEMVGLSLQVEVDLSKVKRYRILIFNEDSINHNHEYYGLSEISKLNPLIKTISKEESKNDKDKMLIDPKYKSCIFTPYELISREVRNIYLYLPNTITVQSGEIIDNGAHGGRFIDSRTKTNFLLNQLYVLMTRATNKIFIYCENKTLSTYFNNRLTQYHQLQLNDLELLLNNQSK